MIIKRNLKKEFFAFKVFLTCPLVLTIFLALFGHTYAQEGGKTLYEANCLQCHGPKGHGATETKVPRIAGQFDWYVVNSLKAFRSGERKSEGAKAHSLNLSEDELGELGSYVSSLR